MPAPLDCVWIITLGKSDVKVQVPAVVQAEGTAGGPAFYPVDSNLRAFHEALLPGPEGEEPRIQATVRIVESRTGRRMTARDALDYLPEHEEGPRLQSRLADTPDAHLVTVDCARPITLAATLTGDHLAILRRWREEGRLGKVRRVLLLETRRPAKDRFGGEEPVATGRLLQAPLAAALELPPEKVECVVFLEEGRLDETDAAGQEHLRTEVAARIDAAVRRLREEFPGAELVLTDVAGMKSVQPMLAASARYRFGERVRFLRDRAAGTDGATPHGIPPEESLNQRRQILELVGRGAFDAAARIAGSAAKEVRKVEPWRDALASLSAFLEGEGALIEEGAVKDSAIARAMREIHSARNGDATPDRFGAGLLLAAFRVESALRSGNWVWAFRETYTFCEAIRDEVIDRSLRRGNQSCLSPARDEILLQEIDPKLVESLLANLYENTPVTITQESFKDFNEKILSQQGSAIPSNKQYGPVRLTWSQVYAARKSVSTSLLPKGLRVALSMRHDYDAVIPLLEKGTEFVEALRDKILENPTVTAARNQATHSLLEPRQLQLAREQLEGIGAWSKGNYPFLASPFFKPLWEHAGFNPAAPRALYQQLIDAVAADLDAYSLAWRVPAAEGQVAP